jgi:hypothetical protein
LLDTWLSSAEVGQLVARHNVDTVIYDEEFAASLDAALAEDSACRRIVAWTDDADAHA